MKVKMFVLVLGLLISLPGYTMANGKVHDTNEGQQEKAPCNCQEQKHHFMKHRDWQSQMAKREQKLLAWVDQFTPEKKAEWTKVLSERKTLHNEWMSSENAEKREKWKQEKLAKIEELKKQFDEGKLTKEEFIKKSHSDKEMIHWKTIHELKLAIEKKDKKQAAALLNKLLEQSKQHNQQLHEMLKKE